MLEYLPKRVLVDRAVVDSPIVSHVVSKLSGVPIEEFEDSSELLRMAQRERPTLSRSKKVLVLAHHRGRFLKGCPAGTVRRGSGKVCCNYFVINYASNCHMECSYCYLQTHLNFPFMVVYANCDDLFSELDETFRRYPDEFFRIGTGELADSLALDPLTGFSVPLVEFFAQRENAVLEFKTKSDCVDNLIGLDHRRRSVVSWSLNSLHIQRSEEHKTATIESRLTAARRCVLAGYPVSFHLDPLVLYPGWQSGYESLIRLIFEAIPPEGLAWISMGSLRMQVELKAWMRHRFPYSPLPLGELVPGEDGKLRYFKPLRIELYRHVLAWIRNFAPETPVYACMETPGVWAQVFDGPPPDERTLGRQLTSRLIPLTL